MKRVLTIFFLFASISAYSQEVDTIRLKKDLLGAWELLYSLDLDTNNVVRDTIKTDSLRATIGLIIDEKSVDEYWDFWDYPDDSTAFIGKGNWELRYLKKTNEVWIYFDCEGICLCGYHQFISLKDDLLTLKSCSKYDYEGCQLDYLKRMK